MAVQYNETRISVKVCALRVLLVIIIVIIRRRRRLCSYLCFFVRLFVFCPILVAIRWPFGFKISVRDFMFFFYDFMHADDWKSIIRTLTIKQRFATKTSNSLEVVVVVSRPNLQTDKTNHSMQIVGIMWVVTHYLSRQVSGTILWLFLRITVVRVPTWWTEGLLYWFLLQGPL